MQKSERFASILIGNDRRDVQHETSGRKNRLENVQTGTGVHFTDCSLRTAKESGPAIDCTFEQNFEFAASNVVASIAFME
jgi:hypothetical protein